MIVSMFDPHAFVPAMPCCAATPQQHREHEPVVKDSGVSSLIQPVGFLFDTVRTHVSALVTKLLDRKQMSDPKAVEAIQKEGSTLVNDGTWDETTVTERADLLAEAKRTGRKIHWGDILTLCSIKFFEKHPDFWKYKGRICFRGDSVKDEDGAPAVFQEMSSSPAAIQSINANVAYGMIPGRSSSVSDALSAYIQTLLKSKYPTWVTIPKPCGPSTGTASTIARCAC